MMTVHRWTSSARSYSECGTVAVANRIAASLGLHNRTPLPLSQEEELPILAELATRRTISSEWARLLAGEETVTALRHFNDAAWVLN
jgi:hypothetical protein